MDEVESAFLQVGTMINGCHKTETILNTTKLGKTLRMSLEPGFLVVVVNDKVTKIPGANIRGVWMKEDKPKKK